MFEDVVQELTKVLLMVSLVLLAIRGALRDD